jgi:F-box-like
VDGIFLQIFDYLDENDLENCENVCCRWQKLIRNHTWRKLLHVKVVKRFFGVDSENFHQNNNNFVFHLRKLKHCPSWQTYWRKIESDKHLCYLESWEKYKIISSEMKVKYCRTLSKGKISYFPLGIQGIVQKLVVWKLHFSLVFLRFQPVSTIHHGCKLPSAVLYRRESYDFGSTYNGIETCKLKNSTLIKIEVMSFFFIQKITALAGKFTCFEMKNGLVMAGIMGTVIVYELMTGKQVVNFYFPLHSA